MADDEEADAFHYDDGDDEKVPEMLGANVRKSNSAKSQNTRRPSLMASLMGGGGATKSKHLSSPDSAKRRSKRNSVSSQGSSTSGVRESRGLSKILNVIDRRRSSIMTRIGYTHTMSGRTAAIDLDALAAYDPNKARPFSAPNQRGPHGGNVTKRANLTAEEKAWEERWTIDELPYYYNSLTQGVTWEKPDALKTDEELEHEAGEWTWVPHPTSIWQGARVLKKQQNGDVHCKTLQGAKTMVIPASRIMKDSYTNGREQKVPLWPLVKSSLYILEDDLVALDDPNEGLILHNLRARFMEGRIYTWVGASRSVLVSLNPYKQLSDMYSRETIQKQHEKSPNKPPPPHVFGIASDALDSLLYDAQNNSILISGESGAGKTEATKHVLKFLAAVAGTKSQVEKRVLEANPILEAFGNAKTLRNNNSSRFGKWIEVNFDSKTRQISGASITTYLLERSRVIYQSKGERNFHIFYQICTNDSFRDQYGLTGSAEYYRYLSVSGCVMVDGIDDAKNLASIIKSMGEMGFENEEQEWIFRTICAILHLGQIDFLPVDDIQAPPVGTDMNGNASASQSKNLTGSKVSSVKRSAKGGRNAPVSKADANRRSSLGRYTNLEINSGEFHLREAARLLCIQHTDLEKALCFRTVSVRGETSTIPLNPEEARNGADSFAMTIYSRMFEWMVARLNQGLGGNGKGHFIGVLDIFGFEIFEKNSFEQLCINFANEKLQEQFNASMFQEEEGLYDFEEIEFERVKFQDNALVVTLIEGKPDGLLPQLDDEVRAPGGSDERYMSKMGKLHEKNERFKVDLKKKIENNLAFQVIHYAGVVKYDAQGFVQANTDQLYEDMHVLGHKSSDKFLAYLFPMEDGKPAHFAPVFSGSIANNTKKTRNRGPSTAANPGGAQKEREMRAHTRRVNTVSSEFRDQLSELLELLEQTNSRYIRCVKPNGFQQGDVFDSMLVLEQLKYSGVFEAVEIRRKGFPFRWTHRQFVYQYKIINTLLNEKVKYRSRDDDYAGLAAEIIENAPGKPKPFREVKIGKTRVLYRAKEHKLLSLLRNLALDKMIPWLQARLRGYIARRMRRVFRECDDILQDAMDLENDLDALEKAFEECDELIGPHIPVLFPRAQPLKRKLADKLVDELKQWEELEVRMEELENDPRDVNEIFFDLRACLQHCDALSHIPLTRRQERLVTNLREKVENCIFQQLEERWAKMQERAKVTLETLDREKFKAMILEFERDTELADRTCDSVVRMREILAEMDDLDSRLKSALHVLDREAMIARLKEAEKYPPTHETSDMKECKRLLALPELEFCKLELAIAIRDKDEKRRIHREIRLLENDLDEMNKSTKNNRGFLDHPLWRDAETWTKKAPFMSRMFSKEKIHNSFKVYSDKPIHFPLTSFGFPADDPDGDNPERRKQAIMISKMIVTYLVPETAAKKQTVVDPDDLAKSILDQAMDPSMRNEILMHIFKMLNGNAPQETIKKGEELLRFFVMSFKLDEDFEKRFFLWSADRFGKDSPECQKYWATLVTYKYEQPPKSVASISKMRKDWESLVRSKYALEPGKSTGPTPPTEMSLT